MLEEYKRIYDGSETTEFVYEGEQYDVEHPVENDNSIPWFLWVSPLILLGLHLMMTYYTCGVFTYCFN